MHQLFLSVCKDERGRPDLPKANICKSSESITRGSRNRRLDASCLVSRITGQVRHWTPRERVRQGQPSQPGNFLALPVVPFYTRRSPCQRECLIPTHGELGR